MNPTLLFELVHFHEIRKMASRLKKIEVGKMRSQVESFRTISTEIYSAIREGGETSSGEIYQRVRDKLGIGYTTFYRVIEFMLLSGLIKARFSGKGKRGRTRIFTAELIKCPHCGKELG